MQFKKVKRDEKSEVITRHRFQSFWERISNINVDIFHQIRPQQDSTEPSGACYFQDKLFELQELDLTRHFREFLDEVKKYCQSLPQLLFHKTEIFQSILKHLQVEKSLALKSILLLCTALAKDLRQEFYPFFAPLISILYKILDVSNPELIEDIFTNVCYLFKYLQKQLLSDLNSTFDIYRPFLFHKTEFVRYFASEGLAFLVRKLNQDQLVDHFEYFFSRIPEELKNKSHFLDGLGVLFFESTKGIKHQFHSRASFVLSALFKCLETENLQDRIIVISNCLNLMCKHCDKEHSQPLWNALFSELSLSFDKFKENEDKILMNKVSQILSMYQTCVQFDEGSIVADTAFEQIKEVLQKALYFKQNEEILHNSLLLFSTVFNVSGSWKYFNNSDLLNQIFSISNTTEMCNMFSELLKSENYPTIFDRISQYCNENISKSPQAIVSFVGNNSMLIKLSKKFKIEGFLLSQLKLIQKDSWTFGNDREEKYSYFYLLLNCFFNIHISDSESISNELIRIIQFLDLYDTNFDIILQAKAIEALVLVNKPGHLVPHYQMIKNMLPKRGSNLAFLRGLNKFFSVFENKSNQKFNESNGITLDLNFFIQHLTPNLSSPINEIRQQTLLLIHYQIDKSKSNEQYMKVFNLFLRIEEIPFNPIEGKEISLRLLDLNTILYNEKLSDELLAICNHFVLGTLFIKLSFVWSVALKILTSLAESNFSIFWSIYQNQLVKISSLLPVQQQQERNSPETNSKSLTLIESVANQLNDLSNSTHIITYDQELWKLLIQMSSIISKKTSFVISAFGTFLNRVFRKYYTFSSEIVPSCSIEILTGNKKMIQAKLETFLNIFSKYPVSDLQPWKDELQTTFLLMLSSSDEKIQNLAFRCILNLNPQSSIVTYRTDIEKLINHKSLRRQLTLFKLESLSSKNRLELSEVLVPVLFGRMTSKKGKTEIQAKRRAIFGFCSGLENGFEKLLEYVLRSFQSLLRTLKERRSKNNAMEEEIPEISIKKQDGFLNVLGDLIVYFESKITEDLLNDFLTLVLYFLEQSFNFSSKSHHSDVRRLSQLRLAEIFNRFPYHNYELFWPQIIIFLQKVDENFPSHFQDASSYYNCILTIAKYHSLVPLLIESCVIKKSLTLLSNTNLWNASALNNVFQFLEALLILQSGERAEQEEEQVKETQGNDNQSFQTTIVFSDEEILVLLKQTQELINSNVFTRGSLFTKQLNFSIKLSKLVKNPSHSSELVNSLIPILKTKLPENNINDILKLIQIHLEECETSDASSFFSHIPLLGKLFGKLKERKNRNALCQIFEILSSLHLISKELSNFLWDVNAYSTKRINEYDFGRRLRAFAQADSTFREKLSKNELLIVLANYFFFLNDGDISIRNNSSSGISDLIKDLAHESQIDKQSVINETVFPFIKKFLKISDSILRKELLNLLSTLARLYPSQFPDLNKLVNVEEPEIDFYYNISHIQIHRRSRALRRFQQIVSDSNFSKNHLVQIFLPLFTNMLLESKPSDHNFVEELCNTIGITCKYLSWNDYYYTFRYFVKKIPEDAQHENQLVKVICNIIDNFHFQDLANSDQAAYAKIQTILKDQVIVDLRTLLKDNKKEQVIRINVALAIVDVLKLLPEETVNSNLPNLITIICQNLQSRVQSIRNQTRETLIKVTKSLKPSHLLFIVEELKSALTRGYQIHVLGYTLHALLKSTISSGFITPGSIDYCLNPILEILFEDITGEVAEQKEVEQISKAMKESKNIKSFESFELIGRVITFPSSVQTIIDQIKLKYPKVESLKKIASIGEILSHLSKGLKLNLTVDLSTSLIFSYKLVSSNLKQKKRKHEESTSIDIENHPHTGSFVAFGLSILYGKLKKKELYVKNKEHLEMLDPFIPVLRDCLASKENKVVSFSMKCLTYLIPFPLPSIKFHIEKLLSSALKFVDINQGIKSALSKDSLKFIVAAIRDQEATKFTEKQLVQLLEYITLHLDNIEGQHNIIFSLFKSIMNRKLVVVQIYDVMEKIVDISIRSQLIHVRKQCSQLFVQFLMHYPLGETRLKQHLSFLINNLNYIYENGRNSVLETILHICQKFPQEVLLKYIEFLFLPLVTRLVNEESFESKKLITKIIKIMLERTDGTEKGNSLLLLTLKWFESEKTSLIRTGLILLGLFVEIIPKKVTQELDSIIKKMLNILESNFENEQEWEIIYLALHFFEKLLQYLPVVLEQSQTNELLKNTFHYLLFPHTWVQLSSNRITITLMSMKRENPSLVGKQSEFFEEKKLEEMLKTFAVLMEDMEIIGDLRALAAQNFINIVKLLIDIQASPDLFHWIFRRLSFMAKVGEKQKSLVITSFQELAHFAPQGFLEPYLVPILFPLMKLVQNPQKTRGKLKGRAAKALEVVKSKVSQQEFLKVFSEAYQSIQNAKTKRKQNQAILAATHPEIVIKRHQKMRERLKSKRRKRAQFYSNFSVRFKFAKKNSNK